MIAKLHNPTSLWHNGQRTGDADVDQVDSLTAEAMLGNASFVRHGRTGDAPSCIRKALLPIRVDAGGPGIGVGIPSLSMNEHETELAR